LLENSVSVFRKNDLSSGGHAILSIVRASGLVSYKETTAPDGGIEVEVSNFTIINLAIRMLGPTSEELLTIYMLLFQVFCSIVAFYIRYEVALLFYEGHDIKPINIHADL